MFDRIDACQFYEAENGLLDALASGDLRTSGSRNMARLGLAIVQLLGRNDVRGAFSALAPILERSQDSKLPFDVAVRAEVLGAFVFASADGKLFDPGRSNSHARRARELLSKDRDEGLRCLLQVAELTAARNLGDRPRFLERFLRIENALKEPPTLLTRCLVQELLIHIENLGGRVVQATARCTALIDESRTLGFSLMQRRAMARLAQLKLHAVESPDEILSLVREAHLLGAGACLQHGEDEILLRGVEAEACNRRARFDEADEALRAGLQIASALAWPPADLLEALARQAAHRGHCVELDQAMKMFSNPTCSRFPDFVRQCRLFLNGVRRIATGEIEASWEDLQAAADSCRQWGVRAWMEPYARVVLLRTTVMSGKLDEVPRVLRQAEGALERYPSPWLSCLLGIFHGIYHAMRGSGVESAQYLEAALTTLERGNDLTEAAMARRGLAIAAYVMDDPMADQRLQATEAELGRFGIFIPPRMRSEALQQVRDKVRELSTQGGTDCGRSVSELVVPLERLTRHGVSQSVLGEELIEVADRLLDAGQHTFWLDEIDSEGKLHAVVSRGEEIERQNQQVFEFGDGCGRRYQLAVSGEVDSESRSLIRILTRVSSVAMEVAALRAFAEPILDSSEVAETVELGDVIAASRSMRALLKQVSRLSGSKATVLITGESGSGKEVLAQSLHRLSSRRDCPQVTFNCSSIPAELFEGQLFGYHKGAFTGATKAHPGVIRSADRGTLFLDEIGDLPLEQQPKLLRFLENAEIFPLGAVRPVSVDVRVVAATHRDLASMVKAGQFREDLYFRLQVVPIHLPPLRERREDIVPLARHFIARLTPRDEQPPVLGPSAIAALQTHHWPGNVRELRNSIERSLALGDASAVIDTTHLGLD